MRRRNSRKEQISVIELFAGIGACSMALKKIGINIKIMDAVEIDKYAIRSFNALHNTNFEIQDIATWNKEFKEVDLIMHGSPCQDFSIAGKQAGGDLGSKTRSSLMYETIRIVGQIRPKYVLWENVKNILSRRHKHNFDTYIIALEALGYNSYYKILNAKDYGIPQNRERVYTMSIRKDIDKGKFSFPEKEELKLRLKDMLDEEIDEKYYLKDYQVVNFVKNNNGNCNPSGRGMNGRVYEGNVSPTITTNKGEGLKINETNVIGRLVIDKWQDYMKRIYNINSYAPTISTMQGGNTEPKIQVIGNYMPSNHDSSRIVNNFGLAPTVKENHGTVTATNQGFRIRKLTPKECWRLMGFSDEDFTKVQSLPTSNAQLYKQAGNSIVVNVLEKIFLNLFKEENK